MALINRISRLFTADLHAVLDRLEEPEVLLKQSIREMEEAIAASDSRLKHIETESRRIAGLEGKLRDTLTSVDEELDVCFASNEETLARSVVRRKLVTARQLEVFQAQRASLEETAAELGRVVAEQRVQLDDMRQKADVLIDEEAPSRAQSEDGWTVSDADVDVAFLTEARKRSAS